MTGRWTRTDPARSVWRGRRLRGLSLAVGLICALGVLCGAAVRANDVSGQHRHRPVLSAAVLVGDAHALTARGDQFAVAATTAQLTEARRAAVALAETAAFTAQAGVDTVRTRGPPATA